MLTQSLGQLQVGDRYSETVTFDRRLVERYIRLSKDLSGIHVDRSYSQDLGYDELVVHGLLVGIPFSRMLGMHLPGPPAVIASVELDFHQPVYRGETVTYTVTVARLVPSLNSVMLDLAIAKESGSVCLKGRASCVFR